MGPTGATGAAGSTGSTGPNFIFGSTDKTGVPNGVTDYVGSGNEDTSEANAQQIYDVSMTSGTLYVTVQNGGTNWGAQHTITVQLRVNGANKGSALTFSAAGEQNTGTISALGITNATPVDVLVTNSSGGTGGPARVTWTLGP